MSSRGRAWFLIVSLFVSACSLTRAPARAPEVRIAGLQPEQLGIHRQVFLLHLSLDNPNDVRIRVASGRLRLDIEELQAGSGELVEGFVLPPREQGTASVRIETDLVSQAPRFLGWLMSGDATLDYRITGYVDIVAFGLGRLPVDERGRLPLRPVRGNSGQDPVAL